MCVIGGGGVGTKCLVIVGSGGGARYVGAWSIGFWNAPGIGCSIGVAYALACALGCIIWPNGLLAAVNSGLSKPDRGPVIASIRDVCGCGWGDHMGCGSPRSNGLGCGVDTL